MPTRKAPRSTHAPGAGRAPCASVVMAAVGEPRRRRARLGHAPCAPSRRAARCWPGRVEARRTFAGCDRLRSIAVVSLIVFRSIDCTPMYLPPMMLSTASTTSGTHSIGDLVGVVVQVLIARLAREGQRPAAHHVERRDVGDDRRHDEEQPVPARCARRARLRRRTRAACAGSCPCCSSRRRTACPAIASTRDDERDRRHRDLPPQAAVLRHFLLVVGRVDHRPEPRNSSALKNAWVIRWNSPPIQLPTPIARIM